MIGMSIVIVYGGEDTGKTRRSAELKKHYGCRRVLDGWDGLQPLKSGDLALTNLQPPFQVPGAQAVSIERAKQAICG